MQRSLRRIKHRIKRLVTSYVSPLGWAVTGLAIASLIAFTILSWHELLTMAIVFACMMVAAIMLSLGNTSFTATIDVSSRRVTVSDTVKVDVCVDNPGRTPTTSARGDLPIGDSHERFAIPMLAAGQSRQTTVEFTAVSRAVLPVGPLSIRKGDPFGLVRHEKKLADQINVFIHPKTVMLNTLNAGIPRDLEGHPSGEIVDDDLDFYGLREYEPGDDVRNVHWLSSAKTGALMIRQYEATRRTDTALTISVNPDDYVSSDEFELAVSVHASIGVQCLLQNRPVTSHAGTEHIMPRNSTEFLDGCSVISPDISDNPNLAQTTLAHAPDSSFYYITVGRLKNIDEIKHMALALPPIRNLRGTANRHRTATRHQTIRRFHPGDRRKPRRSPNDHGGTGMSTTGLSTHNTNTGDTGRTTGFGNTFTGTGTGSWADSTHSVIWMSRDGKSQALPYLRRTRASQYASLLVAALLTLAAASNLIDVYGSAASWALAALPATIIGSLVALAGTVPVLRLWWQMLFMAVAQLVVGPVLFLNDTTIAHIVPTLRTLTQGWMNMLGSFKFILSVEPPTGTADGCLLAVWTICLWFALLTGIFAVTEDGRFTMIAIIPVTANLAICALLGSSSGYYRMFVGTIMALILVIWISARWKLLELGRWLSSVVIVVLSVALAIGGCLVVDQDRTVLRDHYDPPLSPYNYTSPLSGMRSYITNSKDDVLLTVENLPAGSSVRLAVMDRFDGNVWNLSDSTMSSDSSNYRRVGTSITNNAEGKKFTATFTVDKGLSDYWLPMAGAASSVTFDNSENSDSFYYNSDTMSAIYPSRTSEGLTYTETGIMPTVPTDKQIAKTDAAAISQPKAEDVPDCVDKLATAIAGGQSKGGEAAQALAEKLKESGWFSHGLSGDYPSTAGHGNYRIDQLLAGTAMVGDSEQYASAMALMARSLGLPSRVVLGFLPKDDEGEISESRTEEQGTTTITKFTGNDVTAWVEIKLDGYGWVAFYPTPKETKVPDENQNLTPPNPQTLVRQPPVPLTDPLRDDTQAKGKSSIGGSMADETSANLFWQHFGRIARKVAIYGSPLWTLLIICGLLLAIKAIALARSRKHGSTQQRVAAGWQSVAALARQSGLDIRGTRSEQAVSIANQMDISRETLLALGAQADYAAFSGNFVNEEHVQQYWRDIAQERKYMLKSLPTLRRWRAKLSLADVFHFRSNRSGRNNGSDRKHNRKKGRDS